MKKILLAIIAFMCVMPVAASAFPKALYVKKGNSFSKYNFGVAGDLLFGNNGRTLSVSGYDESIDLSAIDYISFSAPVDETALKPKESKERLLNIGKELNSKIDINDQAEIVKMLDIFARKYAEYEIDIDDLETRSAFPAKVSAMLSGIRGVASGKLAAIRKATRSGAELYELPDYDGIFSANSKTEMWDKVADADYLEFRYPAADGTSQYRIKATKSEVYTDWTEVDFIGRVPESITIEASLEGKVLVTVTITSKIDNKAKAAKISTVANLQNDYQVSNILSIANTAISDEVKVAVKGESIVSARSVIHGTELTNYDQWKTDIDNSTEDDEYYDEELGEYIYVDGNRDEVVAGHFTYATSEVDLMGKLQLKGRISAISKLQEVLSEDSELDNSYETWDEASNTLIYTYEDKDVIAKQVLHLNNYSDVSLYYDGASQQQGYISYEMDEDDSDKWYDESTERWDEEKQDWVACEPHWVQYIYYEPMPLLTFPDLSKFAIEDFFNETDFASLIDDFNAIIDSYYVISGNDPDE